jgi:uncharacterized protein (TIGR03435 family)
MRAISVWIAAAVAAAAFAQEPAREFEAASVKPAVEVRGAGMFLNRCTGGPGSGDPTRLTCSGLTLKTLLTIAYGVQPDLVAGPSWIESERYNIAAKVPAGAPKNDVGPMLQRLLTDRFQMTIRRELRTMPYYALLTAKAGPKLKPGLKPGEEEDQSAAIARGREAGRRARELGPGWIHLHIDDQRMTMPDLADALAHRLERPVMDMTGLGGVYAIELDCVVEGQRPQDSDAHPLTVQQALEELGLRMESRKGEVSVVVVESASKMPRE